MNAKEKDKLLSLYPKKWYKGKGRHGRMLDVNIDFYTPIAYYHHNNANEHWIFVIVSDDGLVVNVRDSKSYVNSRRWLNKLIIKEPELTEEHRYKLGHIKIK